MTTPTTEELFFTVESTFLRLLFYVMVESEEATVVSLPNLNAMLKLSALAPTALKLLWSGIDPFKFDVLMHFFAYF